MLSFFSSPLPDWFIPNNNVHAKSNFRDPATPAPHPPPRALQKIVSNVSNAAPVTRAPTHPHFQIHLFSPFRMDIRLASLLL